MLTKSVLASALILVGQASFAESYKASLTNTHEIAAKWKSQQGGTVDVTVALSEDGTKLDFDLVATGLKMDELAAAGPEGVLGTIHIHNLPQGGPNFFVLQLPGTFAETADGFALTLKDWTVEAPKGGAKVDAAFVVDEIRKGNAYIGLHTVNLLCRDKTDMEIACAAPATALSGQISKVEN